MEPETPAPPPEARLIRTAREAAGMSASQAAQATAGAVSATYWRDVERGYGGRRGQRAPARASDMTLAAMARATGRVTPEQLAEVQREGAARVLAEILRGEGAAAPASPVLSAVPSPPFPYAPADVKDEVITLQHGMIRELVPHLPQEMQETVGRWMDLIDATWRLPQDDRAELLLQVLQRRLPRPAESAPPPGERRPGTASLTASLLLHVQVHSAA